MEELPPDWDRALPIAATQELALGWLEVGAACGLDVPSAIIPLERNLILNPRHPDFETLKVLSVQPFRFDPRHRLDARGRPLRLLQWQSR